MIKSLHIENLVTIGAAKIDFHRGFNVLTGEPGSGKSLVLKSIRLLLGMGGRKSWIKPGAKKLHISGIFLVRASDRLAQVLGATDGLGPCEEVTLKVDRELTVVGGSRCWINGEPVRLGMLKELGYLVSESVGQHEQTSLADSNYQLSMVDRRLAGNGDLEHYRTKWRALQAKLQAFRNLAQQVLETKDQVGEDRRRLEMIGEVDLDLTELTALLEMVEQGERQVSEARLVGAALDILCPDEGSSPRDAIVRVSQILGRMSEDSSANAVGTLKSAAVALEEVEAFIASRQAEADYLSHELNQAQERLFKYETLRRKVGAASFPELLEECRLIEARVSQYDQHRLEIEKLLAELIRNCSELSEIATVISQKRREVAKLLEGEISAALKDLLLPSARFRCEVLPLRPTKHNVQAEIGNPNQLKKVEELLGLLCENGADRVSFEFAPSRHSEPQPVGKIASGGELSRLLLATKVSLGEREPSRILLFDEIDSGLSGRAAVAVGQKLKMIGEMTQIIAVSHLPQVVFASDHHFLVEKIETAREVVTRVNHLDDHQKSSELSRFMFGLQ